MSLKTFNGEDVPLRVLSGLKSRAENTAARLINIIGVVNGLVKFLTARKILPLLDLLAKCKRVLACSCFQNVYSCWQPRFLVSIARNFVNPSLG